MQRVKHPSGVDIIFDAKWHQYKIGHTALRSVSKVLDKYFPFDEKRIVEHVSRKTGESPDVVRATWARQALLGKNVHAYIESRLLDRPPPLFVKLLENRAKRAALIPPDATGPSVSLTTLSSSSSPSASGGSSGVEATLLHGEEALYLPQADRAVDTIKAAYDVLGVEQIIASPEWGIAGTIDFIGRHKTDHTLLIGDWKTTTSVGSNFRFGSFETPCMGCLRHLPNSKFYRYAMQVAVYGEVLTKERYFEHGYFDVPLRQALLNHHQQQQQQQAAASATSSTSPQKGSEETSAPESSSKKKKKGKKAKKGEGEEKAAEKALNEAGSPSAVVGSVPLEYYHGAIRDKLRYGIVQLLKDEEGMVGVEYKEVTPATVLPCDNPEMSFLTLLQAVMHGE